MSLLVSQESIMFEAEKLKPEFVDSGLNGCATHRNIASLMLADPHILLQSEPLMNTGYYFVSREISRHPVYFSAPPTYKIVLQTILDRMNFQTEKFDDHGQEITVQPGQLVCTIRQLAEWANVDKNSTERAIAKFTKVKILRQEVRHKKTILTIAQEYIFKGRETRSETKVRQERDIKEKGNNAKSKNTHSSYSLSAIELLSFFEAALKKHAPLSKAINPNEAAHFEKLLQAYPAETIKNIITFVFADEYWAGKIQIPKKLVVGSKDNPDRFGLLISKYNTTKDLHARNSKHNPRSIGPEKRRANELVNEGVP